MRYVRRRSALLTAATAALLLLPAGPPAAATDGPSPWADAVGHLDPDSLVAQEVRRLRRTGQRSSATALQRIARQPQFRWLGDWTPVDRVREQVRAHTAEAQRAGRVAQLVLYAVPHRDCGAESAGGLTAADYRRWVGEVAAGLTGRTAVVVEPDGLALLDCLEPAQRAERTALLREAVTVLAAAGAAVYLDAGHADWHPPAVIAERLRAAGVDRARGVSLNVAGWGATDRQVRYAEQLAGLLPGLHAVVDTSRNGRGGVPGQWCNVPGQALGATPRAVDSPVVDALVWVKRPGESDGDCGRGEPAAGRFWPAGALELVRGARAAGRA